jgi:hypothetical protein
MPPYKKAEFTATSGNHADIKIYRRGNIAPMDISWENSPTEADMRESEEWLQANHETLFPGTLYAGMLSRRIEDPVQRAAAIDNLLGTGRN